MLTVGVKGSYNAERLNVETGTVEALKPFKKDGFTYVTIPFWDEDSASLHFTKADVGRYEVKDEKIESIVELASSAAFSLSEENTLMLDMAEWSLDGGEFNTREEILRIDDAIRLSLGYSKRSDAFAQPWLTSDEETEPHDVALRFRFNSAIEYKSAYLAYESGSHIEFNGNRRELKRDGTYVDSCISRCLIGDIVKGENILTVHVPFGKRTNLEAFMLLGHFGVAAFGDKTVVTALPESLGFTDICAQGLPFYGGNIDYEFDFVLDADDAYYILGPSFGGALVDVVIDDSEPVAVYQPPFKASFPYLKKGSHHAKIRLYGTRINQFGQLHCCRRDMYWGPKSWRTQGAEWSYAYQLRSQGLLASIAVYKSTSLFVP